MPESTQIPVSYTHLDVYKRQHVTILMTGEDENEEYDIVGRTEADPLNLSLIHI